MGNNTAKLLGLEDVIVKEVQENGEEIILDIEMPRKTHICPACGEKTDTIHDYRLQQIKDLSAFGKLTILRYRKRRYRCCHCGKKFFEKNTFVPRYHRVTRREVASIINEFRSTVSATFVAKKHNISTSTALRYFDLIGYGKYVLPEVLAIDEFKGNANGEKYQCIVADPKHHIKLDILPSRKTNDLIQYFLKFPRWQRMRVKCIVMDMSSLFYSVMKTCFPKAIIVADRYHVVRQAVWAFENVRKAEQKKLSTQWRRYWKRSRSLLNKHTDSLSAEEDTNVRLILSTSPRLELAYHLKNDFLDIMHLKDSNLAAEKLSRWIFQVETSELSEFRACITAVRNWYREIINSFDYRYTNGFVEGCNNKTKVLKRVCFGVRKFSRFRNRILFCS